MNDRLILSLFPGIDMLGMGFELAGFTVVRGPDPLFGGDNRNFKPPADTFGGIIAGTPCQDFSKARRTAPTGYGIEMLHDFRRCVITARPTWFLLENVPNVPAIVVPGYTVQRIHVRASEFGGAQHRLRILQFGYSDEQPLILDRPVSRPKATESAAMASEGTRKERRTWEAFCALQGLQTAPALDSFTLAGKYRAVGNGVYIPMAATVAKAIEHRHWNSIPDTAQLETDADTDRVRPCACGCARPVHRRTLATTACRKRAQRQRDAAAPASPWKVTIRPRPSSEWIDKHLPC